MSKKRTTKFTRIAVAGLTASDGRTIEPQWLRDIAATYDPSRFSSWRSSAFTRGANLLNVAKAIDTAAQTAA